MKWFNDLSPPSSLNIFEQKTEILDIDCWYESLQINLKVSNIETAKS